ncbi:hypothetical protein HOY80DRAFT_1056069 [Tuber brumale]|nr:hypothetical protein HOY80DRAFT_1056069 [Tuber brumale]
MADYVTRIHTNETSGARNGSANGSPRTSNGLLPPTSTDCPTSLTDKNRFLLSSMDGTFPFTMRRLTTYDYTTIMRL